MRLILVQPQLGVTQGPANLEAIATAVLAEGAPAGAEDVLLLPEHVLSTTDAAEYESAIAHLARDLGCHVIGGSHHQARAAGRVNAGVAVDPSGRILGRYEKVRPYALERERVSPGVQHPAFEVCGRRVRVLVCADFWFADVLQAADDLPDLVLVPALSVTRKPTPDYSRALWRHLAVARAYEYGVFVGVSDWGYPSALPTQHACGVAGLADPTTTDPSGLFTALGDAAVRAFSLDFEALEAFRDDRRERGFFWRS